jgi:hypothetical protein
MSPILFNIFINDMFNKSRNGVKVPTSVKKDGSIVYLNKRISGLLFADDAAALASSEKSLSKTLQLVKKWSDSHEMTFGVEKCGLMKFSSNPNDEHQIEALDFIDKNIWQIDGIEIPVVQHYVYLGLDFHSNLDLSKMVKLRTEKGRKVLYHLKPLLRCCSIPTMVKLTILRTIVIPVLLYGAELWGLSATRTIRQQSLINKALRWTLNYRGPITLMSIGAIHEELDVESLRVQMANSRVRAYIKYPTLKTWIATLCQNPQYHRKTNWFTNTEHWLNRYVKANVGKSRKLGFPDFCTNMKEALSRTRRTVGECVKKTWRKSAASFSRYEAAKFVNIQNPTSWIPYFGNGLVLISIFRGEGYWVISKLFRSNPEIRRRWKNKCPFCNIAEPEDITHILLKCSAWNEERQKFLAPLLVECRQIIGPDRYVCSDVIKLLLGGCVGNSRLPNWSANDLVIDPEKAALADFEDSLKADDTAPVWRTCGMYRMAAFLNQMDYKRRVQFVRCNELNRSALNNSQGTQVYD